jgi:multidrug efflux system outer membrane protein
MRVALVSFVAVSVASCTMGPDYRRPEIDLPAVHRGAVQTAHAESLADLEWFELFRDEQLTLLVASALKDSFEVRIAAERVLQARALYGITRSNQVPAVDAVAGVNAVRSPRNGASGAVSPFVDSSLTYVEAGFNVGWELDVWGRVRRLNEAARAQYLATEEARRGVITTLVADVADSYLALRALDLELEIARRTRDVADDSLQLTRVRHTSGVGSGLDLRQGEQLLFTAGARIASLEREIAHGENALSLLVGRLPGDVRRGGPLDTLQAPPSIPAGLPSALLERRPDVRQAEQELIAANAQIGAIKAELFPQIALTGFLGAQSRALSDLLSAPARVASASLGAAAPLFDRGRRRRNVELAEAIHREALVNYQRVVYTAFRDVADALAAYEKTSAQRAEQQRLVDALRESSRLSNARYRGGIDSYLPVLDSQRNLFEGELELARLHQRELSSIVQLYRALGGGWSES